jgi:hypothetical protein
MCIGKYCPSGSTTYTPCPTGSYSNVTGASTLSQLKCKPCPLGSYSNANITGATSLSQLQCRLCPAGYFCPLGSTTYKNCPSGYTSYGEGEGQYCLYNSYTSYTTKLWNDAKSDCASRSNGWLVSITDANKDSVVNSAMNNYNNYWIGGTRTSILSTVWTWDHGESWSYNNPNMHINQNGLCMYMYTYSNYWYDTSCSNSLYYINATNNSCMVYVLLCIYVSIYMIDRIILPIRIYYIYTLSSWYFIIY